MDTHALYEQIGEFLNEHGLWPSPQNYALIYQLFADTGSPAALAVKAATGDGVRLTQGEANEIMDAHGLQQMPERHMEASGAALIPAIRDHVETLSGILEHSQADAHNYGRELEEGAAKLEDAGDAAPVATLIAITRAMAERTKAAEQQLLATRHEALSLRAKLAEAEEEARSDPLTGLANRRAFEERMEELRSSGLPFCVAICDVDNFKRVNDQYGHGVGDRVLRTVARLIEGACAGHLVARLGGEEFVVLFEQIETDEAARILDDTRDVLAARHFKLRETDAPIGRISFSAGIASGTREADELPMKRADKLLYEAKNAGRNQVRYET